MTGTGGVRFVGWAFRRICGTVLVLLGASFLLFAVVHASPGDAASSLGLLIPAEGESTPDVRSALGLEASWHVQYRVWLQSVAHGDFGRSLVIQRGRPVSELLWPAARRSFSLAGTALFFSTLASLCLATLRRSRPFSRPLAVLGASAHLISALPVFLLAYVAVAGGNHLLMKGVAAGFWTLPGWFPFPSMSSSEAWVPWTAAALILAVGDGFFLDLYQRFRTELDHSATGEHLVGARVLGLSIPLAVARGFLPGAASHLARRVAFSLGSLVVLESALGWPGMGYLAWRAAGERDTPVLLGVALVLALVVRVAVVLADGVWFAVDPRSRVRA